MLEQVRLNSADVALEKYFPKGSLTKFTTPLENNLPKSSRFKCIPNIKNENHPKSAAQAETKNDVEEVKKSTTEVEANLKLHIISIVANTIEHIFECGFDEGVGAGDLPPGDLPPLDEFIHRIYRRANLSITNLLTALLFLVRLKEYHPSCKGTYGSGHRLFFSAIIIANKYLYDGAYHNTSWARLVEGRYDLSEINQMECELLGLLKYQLNVKKVDWFEYSRIMDTKLARCWLQRGFEGPENYLFEKMNKNIDWPSGLNSTPSALH